MTLHYSIEYRTVWGEELFVRRTDNIVPLHTTDGVIWSAAEELPFEGGGEPFTYIYEVWREGQCIRRELDGKHRFEPKLDGIYYLDDWWEVFDEKPAYLCRRNAGVAVPVFALRSEGSFGVGDFGDLRKLVEWAGRVGMHAVQILPINDTTQTGTWHDSYPYNSISIYALHPQYLDLRQLGRLADTTLARQLEQRRQALNALPESDYEEVMKGKMAYAKAMFVQNGKPTLESAGFRQFYADNAYWLTPYAAFSYLRDTFGTADFSSWPQHRTYRPDDLLHMLRPGSESLSAIRFYYYLQYNLHVQLKAVGRTACKRQVILKGDIPIGISRNSVEAWTEPYYFNMNGQAGAPPDAFATDGQNWGFPTYNWAVMADDGYQWWLRRFRKMAEYFTAYRIDHILGFFRIWEIPIDAVSGLLGHFSPSLPLTVEEIESYGLRFQHDFMTRPFINDERIGKLFGGLSDEVKANFLQHSHHDVYGMKADFDTQRKIERYFEEAGNQHWGNDVKTKLCGLLGEVLFIADGQQAGSYHPRIAAHDSYIYSRLDEGERNAFDRLYEDYYYHRHTQFWYDEAMRKLPRLVGGTSMMACGEDLGMVPDCVEWVMDRLRILSLKVERMPKEFGAEFADTTNYPRRSVCTISSHDTSTLRGWWEEDRQSTQHYYNNVMHRVGKAPAKASPEICEEVVTRHLQCESQLCILTLQDWLAMSETLRRTDVKAERINTPSDPNNYWHYRMHLTIEELQKKRSLGSKLRKMISASGR